MLSDTHCHIFSYYDDDALKAILPEAVRSLNFIQDIGTKPDDFSARFAKAKNFFANDAEASHPDFQNVCVFRWEFGLTLSILQRLTARLHSSKKTS